MNKRLLLSLGLISGLVLGSPLAGFAAEKKTDKTADAAAAGDKAAKPARPVPFNGKVTAVDTASQTFTLKGKANRVIAVGEETTITGKDGAPAKLDAITVGEEVRGSAIKTGDAWRAKSVTIGAKEKDGAAGAKKAAKTGATPTVAKPGSDAPAEKPAQ